MGIRCLSIICNSIKDKASLKEVLSSKLVLMFCFLTVAIFDTFNTGIIVDVGPTPFWFVFIVNPLYVLPI